MGAAYDYIVTIGADVDGITNSILSALEKAQGSKIRIKCDDREIKRVLGQLSKIDDKFASKIEIDVNGADVTKTLTQIRKDAHKRIEEIKNDLSGINLDSLNSELSNAERKLADKKNELNKRTRESLKGTIDTFSLGNDVNSDNYKKKAKDLLNYVETYKKAGGEIGELSANMQTTIKQLQDGGMSGKALSGGLFSGIEREISSLNTQINDLREKVKIYNNLKKELKEYNPFLEDSGTGSVVDVETGSGLSEHIRQQENLERTVKNTTNAVKEQNSELAKITPNTASDSTYNNSKLENMEALRKKVSEVTEAIGNKTNAFKAEEDAVALNVEAEINKLQELINKIGEVASAIDNIGKNHTIDLKIDESTATALSGLKQSLEGSWTENLTELSTLINGLRLKDNVGENMQKLANAVLNLKSNLNNLSEGGANFLSSINTLVGQGDDLKALATVLKATKSEIAKAKQEMGLDKSVVDKDYFNYNMESMRDSAVQSLSSKYSDVRMVEIERSEKGIVTLTAAIQGADGAWKKFTGNINSDGSLSTKGITEFSKNELSKITTKEDEAARIAKEQAKKIADEAKAQEAEIRTAKIKESYDEEIRLLEEINELKIKNKNASKSTVANNESEIANLENEIKLLKEKREAENWVNDEEQKRVDKKASSLNDKLDNTSNKEYLDYLNRAIKAEKEIQELQAKKDNNIITTGEEAKLNELISLRDQYIKKVNETIATTDKEIDKLEEYNKLNTEQSVKALENMQWSSKDLDSRRNSDSVKMANDALQSIKNRGISGLDEDITKAENKIKDLTAEFIRGESEVEQYEKSVKNAMKSIKNVMAVLGKNMTLDEGKTATKGYMEELVQKMGGKDLDVNFTKVKDGMYQVSASFVNAEGKAATLVTMLDLVSGKLTQVETTGKSARFLDKLFEGWKQGLTNVARYLSSFVGIYEIFNAIKQGAQTVIEFDTALTEMRKVSDESVESLRNFQAESFALADGVGTTALQIQQSTADFMRLGETLDEASESAQVANMLMNVSEFDSIDAATESLIAMKAAYDDLDQMSIINKLNNIGNNYAISTDGLAIALQASASALKTAGNDMDEAIALVTAGNAVVQDPDKVGAGLRTIALRITGTEAAKEELEELGEDTSDFIVQTSAKSQQAIKDFTKVESNNFEGFDILDENGNFKSTYEILLGISEIYEEIVATDKEYGSNMANGLLETLAGRFCLKFMETYFYRTHLIARIA